MKLKLDPQKDLVKVVTFHSTDVSAIGLWDTKGMSWVKDEKTYFDDFNSVFDAKGNEKIANAAVVVEPGGDGNYMVILALRPDPDTIAEELKNKYKEELGISLKTAGSLCLGSPEWVGYQQKDAAEKNKIDVIWVPAGNYVVDAYSLLVKDESGKPKFMQFLFGLFTEEQYKKTGRPVKSVNQSLKFKYTE